MHVLTTVANNPHFGCDLRVVLLIDPENEDYVALCSPDTDQPADEIVRYYRLRYQIEFVIRDAKQIAISLAPQSHTGAVKGIRDVLEPLTRPVWHDRTLT